MRGSGRLIVFTDLDGCLLDERSYSWAPAKPALAALKEAGVPLVLASSKTRREMRRLAQELEIGHPFIVENGGAVIVPEGYVAARPESGVVCEDGWLVRLGTPTDVLAAALGDLAVRTGLRLRGFSTMPVEEVAERTGLDLASAALAQVREFDEPFVIEGEVPDPSRLEALEAAARRDGLRVTRGGRFFHLLGPTDKGQAVRTLLALLGGADRWTSVALGDSANDLEMLTAVDVPILVPRPDGSPADALVAALPGAARAPAPGPAGWNAAVLATLERRTAVNPR